MTHSLFMIKQTVYRYLVCAKSLIMTHRNRLHKKSTHWLSYRTPHRSCSGSGLNGVPYPSSDTPDVTASGVPFCHRRGTLKRVSEWNGLTQGVGGYTTKTEEGSCLPLVFYGLLGLLSFSALYATPPQAIHHVTYRSIQNIPIHYPLFGLDASTEVIAHDDSILTPLLIGKVLPHPSPMSWSKANGTLNYRLSRDADLILRVFDMRGRACFVHHIPKGQRGAQAGYNRYPFTKHSTQLNLSTGVYILYLLSDGELLAKQKIGVKP